MTASSRKSHNRDPKHDDLAGQAVRSNSWVPPEGFSDRLVEAIGDLPDAELGRRVGISKQTIGGFKKGHIPSADRALAIADALGVNYRWLIAGVGPKDKNPPPAQGDSVELQIFDPHSFDEYSRGPPVNHLQVPRDWLIAVAKTTVGLWIAAMPSDGFPDVARQGELVILRDPELPLRDRCIYLLMLDGRPVVRRVFIKPEGLMLRTDRDDDETMVRQDELERLMPAGRVLAAISLNPA